VLEKGKYRALRAVGLYGANASGKSNFLRALSAMAYCVKHSATRHTQGTQLEAYDPYFLDAESRKLPTYFDIDFVAKDGSRYVYYFSFTAEKIIEEELVVYKTSQPARVFYRNEKAEVKKGSAYKGAFKSVKEKLLKNQLFLSKAAQDNVEAVLFAHNFFINGLGVIPNESEFNKVLKPRVVNKFEENAFGRDASLLLVKMFDIGIEDFKILKPNPDGLHALSEDVRENIIKEMNEGEGKILMPAHKVYRDNQPTQEQMVWNLSAESSGTRALLNLWSVILDQLYLGSLIAIDEIELNLHPHICAYLVGLFNSPETNPNGAQLLFSTHDATLLDRTRLRRDQVWLTQKEAQGESILFCINAFKDLKPDTPFGAWYLAGKLGGTPIINDARFIEKLTELLKENGEKE
jgi:AAA15 family ATPase/GTPase